MSGAYLVGGLLALAALVSAGRFSMRLGWGPAVLTQALAAVLLYFALFPPEQALNIETLVVLTPGTTAAQWEELPAATPVVALPGAYAPAGALSVPDLGTALRQSGTVTGLLVVGGGLPERDRPVAEQLSLEFLAAPLPPGISELWAPGSARLGRLWTVSGRVSDFPGGRVELRAPGGTVLASVEPGRDGYFAVSAPIKSEGPALYRLRVLDLEQRLVEGLDVPVVGRAGAALRLGILAGTPEPELKYLRRWAADAGLSVQSRIGVSEGMALREGELALDAAGLDRLDLLLSDERAWATLTAAEKAALDQAVRGGLGLLLRVTGPVPAPVAADWTSMGFDVVPAELPLGVSLRQGLGLDEAPGLTRQALTVISPGGAVLLAADQGAPLALWRGAGRGRVGLWWLNDSYRLALSGAGTAYGTLWSRSLSVLARATGRAEPELPARARVHQRAVLCGLPAGASVLTPAGQGVALSAEQGCAAYWPADAGWHALVAGGERWPFYVGPETAGQGLVLAEAAEATQALAGRALPSTPTGAGSALVATGPGSRWPYFLAWLFVITGLWAWERKALA